MKRFRPLLFVVVFVVQLPILIWLCVQTRSPLPIAVGAALSLPYLMKFRSPWHSEAPPWMALTALGWWSSCMVFALLLPLAWLSVTLGASTYAYWLALGLAFLAGVGSISGRPKLTQTTIAVPGLPLALDGYRIGQISDVHCGLYTPASRVRGWVRRLNALDVDLMTVTGDLITSGSAYVNDVAQALGGLRARDGVFACMGNHDYFTNGEQLVTALQNADITVLRNCGVTLERTGLYVAGVDDTWTRRHDVARAMRDRPHGATSVLLAHDPDLFPQASAHGVTLTLSGHTHGGQLGIPGSQRFSLARVLTKFTIGLFQHGTSWLYVNCGAGTTGPPVRLGAAAELTVLTLKRA